MFPNNNNNAGSGRNGSQGGGTGNPTSALERTQSQYHRKLERQRQLELMEATASGTQMPFMNLSVPPAPDFLGATAGILPPSVGATSTPIATTTRSRETARKFLYDEDDEDDALAMPTSNTTATTTTNVGTGGVTAKELFQRNKDLYYNNHEDQLNLMDHETAIYKQQPSTSSMIRGWVRQVFGSSSSSSPTKDGLMMTDDGYYVTSDHHHKKKRYNSAATTTANAKSVRSNPLLYAILSVGIFLVAYFVFVHQTLKSSNPDNENNDNNSNEYTGVVDHVKGILPGLHSHAQSEAILREENTQRFNTMFDILLTNGLTPKDEFLHYDGPEYMALRWISYTDAANLNPYDTKQHIMIVQRYAMAVLYYDSYIEFQNHYGQQVSIGNLTNPYEQTIGVPNPGWKRKDYWLSEKGICMWYGVQCIEKIVNNERLYQYDSNDGPVLSIMLPKNNVHGLLPRELIAFTELHTIDFSENELRGTFPNHMGALFQLKYLYLQKNYLSGEIPSEIGLLQGLKELYFANNKFTSTLPTELNRLYNIKTISLEHNELSGNIPDLSVCTQLNNLFLDHNTFNGFFPFELSKLTNLYQLHMNDNEFTGTIPPELGNSMNMLSLHFENNKLTGSIPSMLFKYLINLKEIHMDHNELMGEIPTTVGNLQEVHTLSLHHNKLQSSIPTNIGNMMNLNKLYLYNNTLSNTIPTEIGMLQNLEELWLNDNKLGGMIPTTIGQCKHLQTIYLERNDFNSLVPMEFSYLPSLKSLHLQTNFLVGTIPESICQNREQAYHPFKYITADCNQKLTCSCCDQCY